MSILKINRIKNLKNSLQSVYGDKTFEIINNLDKKDFSELCENSQMVFR